MSDEPGQDQNDIADEWAAALAEQEKTAPDGASDGSCSSHQPPGAESSPTRFRQALQCSR